MDAVGPADNDTVTRLLGQAASGDARATTELLPLVYEELRRMAAAFFAGERPGHTLQPTALVHEAYLKLVGQPIEWASRGQFFCVAAKAMRNLLVDHARGRGRGKRGGGWQRINALSAVEDAGRGADPLDVLALDEALGQLADLDERKARLVELRFFAGLTSDEAADSLGISRATAAEDWRMARAWLHRRLKDTAE